MAGIAHLVLTVLLTFVFINRVESGFGRVPETCLDDHTKARPSIDTEDYFACKSWEHQLSCCSVELTRSLENGTIGTRVNEAACGEYSPECKEYIKGHLCFYDCEPMLLYYQHNERTNAPINAPICARYCDAWFEACKDELTCMDNWLEVLFVNPGTYNCPTDGSTCRTFKEVYGDGKGLCDRMLGYNYRYEPDNKNCMVMQFEGDSPNIDGNPYGPANNGPANNGPANKVTSSLVVCLLGLWLLYANL